jgi:hypothetical protein
MDQVATPDTRASRPLVIVGAVAALIVVVAFVAVVVQQRTVPFTTAGWERGRALITKDNPRLRMPDEVVARLQVKPAVTETQVNEMLGPPDDPFYVETATPKKMMVGLGGDMNNMNGRIYIVGIRPKSALQGRSLLVLNVHFDSHKRVDVADISTVDFPPGSGIVPAELRDGGKSLWVKPGGKTTYVP